jgi:RHS repeat-associated protein
MNEQKSSTEQTPSRCQSSTSGGDNRASRRARPHSTPAHRSRLAITALWTCILGLTLLGSRTAHAQTSLEVNFANSASCYSPISGSWTTNNTGAQAEFAYCQSYGTFTDPRVYLGPCTTNVPTTTGLTDCFVYATYYPWGPIADIYTFTTTTTGQFWVQATPATPPKTNTPVGEPINPGAGNVAKEETDGTFAGSAGSLAFKRFYNSADATGTDMGPTWRHSYDQSIVVRSGPTGPLSYPGSSATVSSQYSSASTACTSGFAAMQSQVSAWASASASYTDNVCVISTSSVVVSTLPVFSAWATEPLSGPVEYDLIREDGETLRFTTQGSVINAQPGVSVRLASSGSGFTVTDDQDNVEAYNSSGVLQSITSRAGVVKTMSYDSNGLLNGVTDSFGNALSISRNSANQIASVSFGGGGTVYYGYDSSSRLSSLTNLDSTTRSYLYGNSTFPTALTGEKDETGTQLNTWGYDSQERGTSSQLSGGAFATSLTYNSDGTVTVTDALTAARTFTYTRIGDINRPTSISGSQCPTCEEPAATTYDAAGWVSSRTDYNGNLTCYANDATRGLELVRVEGFAPSSTCPSSLSSYTPASGTLQRKISTTWSSSFRLPTQITEASRTTSFTYDSSGNQLTKTITDPATSATRTWTYTYDSYGHVLTLDGPRTDVSDVTTYTFYSCTTGSECGQLHTVTDAAGNETVYNTYNTYGQPLTVTDPNGTVTTLSYDAQQRLTSREVGSETTSFAYYSTGLLETVTLPDSSTVTYSYDNAHRLTGITDTSGNSIAYTLDALGNRTAEKSYDPSSTLHRTHSRVFNTLSELYQDINAAGTSAVTTTLSYDSNGNQTGVSAPLSRTTSNAYDALNRLSQITDPASGHTYFAYDAENDLTSVQDSLGLTTSYTYNGFGDVTQQVSPDTGTSTNTYDSGGNVSVSTDARSDTANYSYDASNRVTGIVYKNGSAVTDQTLSFSYDTGTNGKGRLVSAADGNQSLSWAYDSHGRVTGKGQTIGSLTLSVGYAYTNADLTAISTPSGQAVAYTYNSNHQVTTVKVNGTTVLSSITYEPFGGVNGWSWGSGDTVSRTYNSDGLISQIVSASVTNGYSFDYANRITGISDSANSALTWSYGYDALDRLTSATTSAITDGWTYDANGNRLSQTGTNATTFNITSGDNQLSSTTGSLVRTYTYNAAGMTTAYGSDLFSYNDRGRMMGVTVGSTTTSYLYNALGQLIEKATGSSGNVYMYDEAGHILGEYDGSGNLIDETVWLGDIPVATLQPSGSSISINYVHSNHLNAPTKVTRSSDNALEWRIDQDPYGTASANQNPGGLGTFVYNLRFPGQIYMSETGLNYNYFRDYDPQVGRYEESDPIGLKGGSFSTYAYVGGNPISEVDPLGLAQPGRTAPYPLPPGPFDFVLPGSPENNAWVQNAYQQISQAIESAAQAVANAISHASPDRKAAEDECYEECEHHMCGRDPGPFRLCFNTCMKKKGFDTGLGPTHTGGL